MAMALDEAASALESLTLDLAVANSCMCFRMGDVRVLSRGLFEEFVDDGGLFRKSDMVDARRTTPARPSSLSTSNSVLTHSSHVSRGLRR